MINYKKLQNGSDVRGIAMEGVIGEQINLTPAIACDIAASFGRWLMNRTNQKAQDLVVSIGRDSRLTGESIAQGVAQGLTGMGIGVADCGMASTPAMFMSTVLDGFDCHGGIMITASHLPFNRNGLKFFVTTGGLEHEDIDDILADCKGETLVSNQSLITNTNLMDAYCDHLRQVIIKGVNSTTQYEKPLTGFKIAVDAGNGAGGFFASKVLEPLGADTTGSLYLDPDGNFPNHIPNPENKEAMEAICGTVISNGCDLGVIFDTDVDRAGAVDDKGNELSRNKLIAVMASIVAEDAPGSVIVTDSVTSAQLKDFIENELHCVHHRFMRGYKNVINESVRLNQSGKESLLAMETSGHGALKENYFLDDGAYLSAKIIIKAVRLRSEGSSLGSLLAKLEEPKEAKEFRIKINCDDFKSYGNKVLADLIVLSGTNPSWDEAPDNHEGYRATVLPHDGWFLLRMSLHDPQMPLNIESNQQGGVNAIAKELHTFLSQYDLLDLSSFGTL